MCVKQKTTVNITEIKHCYISFFLDDEPPKLTCPKDIHVKKTSAGDTVKVDWPLPIYEDNSGETVALFTESVRGSGFRVGRYQVKYEAADRSGNKAFCTFAIVVSGSLRHLFLSRFHRMIYMEDSCTNLNSEDVDPSIIYNYIASSAIPAR